MNVDNVEKMLRYLSLKGTMEVKVQGNSMFPTIKAGDKIIVSSEQNIIQEGDIVVYYDTSDSENIDLVAHRVIKIVRNKFVITKGDNNHMADRAIRKKCIIGKVISVISEDN